MTTLNRLEFGYFPRPLDISSGPITVCQLANLALTVANIEGDDQVEDGWIYAGRQFVRSLNGKVQQHPYSARIFGLPNTHLITHASSQGQDHLTFHLWSLSFFTGMRLTATKAGFVDATPIKPGTLVDFVMTDRGLSDALALAEDFWATYQSTPRCAKLLAAAVHALFLSLNPQHLQFERFMLSYTAIDACFKLAKEIKNHSKEIPHDKRVKWICDQFNLPTPDWANPARIDPGTEISMLRNATMHDALFMDEPLGFALHGIGTDRNLPLEMQALVCRLVVALLGAGSNDYVDSSVSTRQIYGLSLAMP